MAVSAEKITLYNLADLKNTSDDALPNYLNSLGLKQSHTLTDVRLVLGYSAFLVAAACFLWDYKLGFESTKYYTAGAVAVYSLLNTALTMWIWLKEKGIVYVGTAPNGETVNTCSPEGKAMGRMTDRRRVEQADHDRNPHQEERPHLQPGHHHHAQDRQPHHNQLVPVIHRVVRRRRPLRRDAFPDHARLHGSRNRQPGPQEGQSPSRRVSATVHRGGAECHVGCCGGIA